MQKKLEIKKYVNRRVCQMREWLNQRSLFRYITKCDVRYLDTYWNFLDANGQHIVSGSFTPI